LREEEKEEGATAATGKAFKGHAVCHPKKALRGF